MKTNAATNLFNALNNQSAPVLQISRNGDEPLFIEDVDLLRDLLAVDFHKAVGYIGAEAGLEYEETIDLLATATISFVD